MKTGDTSQQLPRHIGIIMDGNRRWARAHRLPVLAGHKKVADEILEPLIEHAADRGISYLTFWAWSTENWGRDKREVEGVMRLFRHIIRDRWDRLHKKGVRIRTIGDISGFSRDIQKALADVVVETEHNTRITAVFALNYGGRDELVRAMKRLTVSILDSVDSLSAAKQQCSRVTTQEYGKFLDTAGIPDPDFIIRTGGEQRLSGFLLWQCQYSEFYFPEWYMPEFTPQRLDEALTVYTLRKRRFGT
ncbi:polyprenyl diphosphate synthase [Patescibacteria group bacterium]|nr:polyprenyl diphosphate synthase [Patescibacteria group bacterium]